MKGFQRSWGWACEIIACWCERTDQDRQLPSPWLRWFCCFHGHLWPSCKVYKTVENSFDFYRAFNHCKILDFDNAQLHLVVGSVNIITFYHTTQVMDRELFQLSWLCCPYLHFTALPHAKPCPLISWLWACASCTTCTPVLVQGRGKVCSQGGSYDNNLFTSGTQSARL